MSSILISNILPISFDLTIKIPSILSDFIISLILLKNSRGGALPALVYMFNPVTFLLSVYHGQLHTVAVLGAVLSVWFLKSQSLLLSAFALALTSSIRQNFSVMIILLTKKSGKLLHPSLILFFLLLFFINIPLFGSPHLMNVFNPVSNYGMWGYTLLLSHLPKLLLLVGFNSIEVLLRPINNTLSLYGGVFYIFWAIIFSFLHWHGKFRDEWTATLFLLLGFYTVGTGFGIQRLVWVIPFFLIYSIRKGFIFILLASNFLVGSYWQWTLNIKYNVDSITANLDILNRIDLLGLVFVGIFGFSTWLYCTYELYNLWKKNNYIIHAES